MSNTTTTAPTRPRPTWDTPAYRAAHLTGRREVFTEHLADGDGAAAWGYRRTERAAVYLGGDGLIDWSRSPLPGDVSAYDEAECYLGGVA